MIGEITVPEMEMLVIHQRPSGTKMGRVKNAVQPLTRAAWGIRNAQLPGEMAGVVVGDAGLLRGVRVDLPEGIPEVPIHDPPHPEVLLRGMQFSTLGLTCVMILGDHIEIA